MKAMRKQTVEGTRRIRIAKVIATVGRRREPLPYKLDTGAVVELRFTTTRQKLGGERTWFACDCGRRCTTLFRRGDVYACRVCQRLCYASQLTRST